MKKQVATKPSLPILTVRGERVVMDFALAQIYGVTTGRFNEAVKRTQLRDFAVSVLFRAFTVRKCAKRGQGTTSARAVIAQHYAIFLSECSRACA